MRVRNWKIGDIIDIKAVVSLLYATVIGHNGIIDKTYMKCMLSEFPKPMIISFR